MVNPNHLLPTSNRTNEGMVGMLVEKRCSHCRTLKPVDQFRLNDKSRDGIDFWCRACRNSNTKESYWRHREKRIAKAKEYARNHPDQRRKAGRKAYWKYKGTPEGEVRRLYKKGHRESPESVARRRQKAHGLRMQAYNALGGPVCVCCGETTFRLLSLDHIDNKGAEHRRSDGTTRDMYTWFIKNGMPLGIFQVLCMGCNWGKSANGGRCPHEDERPSIVGMATQLRIAA